MQQMKQVMLLAAELWLFSAKIHQHRILVEHIQITQAVRVPKVTYPKMNEGASKEQQPDSHWHSPPLWKCQCPACVKEFTEDFL